MWLPIAMSALGIGRSAIFQLEAFGGAVISVEDANSHSYEQVAVSTLNLARTPWPNEGVGGSSPFKAEETFYCISRQL